MIYQTYTDEIAGIDPELDRRERGAAESEITLRFLQALAAEYLDLSALTPEAATTVASATYSYAWAQGHSAGLSDVENVYIDVADLVNTAVNAHRA